MNSYEINQIQVNYFSRIADSRKAIKVALATAETAKLQGNWAAFAELLQSAASEAKNLAELQAASDAFDKKVA
jgi:hypothetical protein